jgi:hypothetical protein
MRAVAEVGTADNITSTVLATRGERLTLNRVHSWALQTELLNVVELNADEPAIASVVVFDADDFDAAIAELDARYLAGEAAAHANRWSVIMQSFASLNRRELPPTTPDWVNIDHRRGTSIAPGEMPALLGAAWNVTSDLSNFIEAVHRLDNLGAVMTHVANETSQEGFHAEWRVTSLLTLDGDLVNRCEVFDESDLDTALARFDQLTHPAPQPENAASRVTKRFLACLAAGDWDAIAETLVDDFSQDDRRRVVGAGVRHGRDAEIADLRAIADLSITNVTSTVIATRGERLALMRVRFTFRDQGPEAFLGELLGICEINADERIVADVSFDLDDVEAALAELDARYLAGEAAPYRHTWSVIAAGYASLNRRELPATTIDFEDIDHRRGAAFAPGDLMEYLSAGWELDQDVKPYIEAVHRLSDLGAVVTHAAYGTSREGFDAEWREVNLLTADGDAFNRCELFDEADLHAATARFDQLSQPAPRLENAAARVYERILAHFAARDWAAITELLAEYVSTEDRRRVVNAGLRHGRDAVIREIAAIAEVAITNLTSDIIATRGDRLLLSRGRASEADERPDPFRTDLLDIVEIDADERVVARVIFDPDDIEAAFAELDARYLAGEAATCSRTWSLVTSAFAAINRHELPELTPDWVNIDYRRGAAFAPGDMTAFVHDLFEDTPDINVHIEAVHRLSNLGVVVAHRAHGTSQEGFEAEWREIGIFTFDGDLLSRCELFDATDLAAALARFEELQPQAQRLENASSRMAGRFLAQFAAGNWDAMAEMLVDDYFSDDRRRVVGAGLRHGRDAQMADMRAIADLWITNVTSTVIATRGERLALTRTGYSGRDQGSEAFRTDALAVGEINADERIAGAVVFDLDDIDAAFEELDARYLAGEAAPYQRTWSVIAGAHAAINRRELPATTPDWVNIDHRRGPGVAPGDATAYIRASFDGSTGGIYVETVCRLSNLGAVVTWAGHGISPAGFEAEWRGINVLTVEGDLINRSEIFDEADIDAALARFEELHRQASRPENPASQAAKRFLAHFAACDWGAMAEMLAGDFSADDRRRVVNNGVQHGRDAAIEDFRVAADLGITTGTSVVIATRGVRLALTRAHYSGNDQSPDAFQAEALHVIEIDADELIAATAVFDVDDIDAAFAELDARYLAGEAANHTHTWSVIARAHAAVNRHEVPATTPGWSMVDHRPIGTFEAADLAAFLDATWALAPDVRIYIEAVHRLNDLGAVVTHASRATSQVGLDVEWHDINLVTVDGDLVDSCEIFDAADIDAAIAKFEQLSRPAPPLENAATRVYERLQAHFAAREWDAMAEILADDHCSDDRRRVVNAGIRRGRDVQIANMQTAVGLGTTNITSTVIATRGERLALRRVRFSGRDQGPEAFHTETLGIVEIDADERIAALVTFDLDDVDPAFAELDARYLAGEAAAHAHTWSVNSALYAAFNRHELPATTPDWIYVDHRPLVTIDDLPASLPAIWEQLPDIRIYMEAVHRLSDLGAVVTAAAYGSSQEGFDAEWRMVDLFTVEGDLISRCEIFDETDVDAALARFEELQPQAPRLENAAGRMVERYQACFSAHDWTAMADLLADDMVADDRRHVVNAGVRRGRDVHIADNRAAVEVGAETISSRVIATRGEHLALAHVHSFNHGMPLGAEMLTIAEIDADERIVAAVSFDLDDVDAAYEELDARYLAGEAAAYAHTWSVIADECAAFNRHELTAADYITVDHRPLPIVEAYSQAALRVWDVTPDFGIHVEAVHRLNGFGTVATYQANGTSPEGFGGEWRMILLLTVEGDRINHCEVYDESDLDAALARFEELQPQEPRLENRASQIIEQYQACFATRDWAAMAELLADDIVADDRRRVVNAGARRGREVQIADLRAAVDVGAETISSTVIATRGERLALAHVRSVNRFAPGEVGAEMLGIAEIDADERIVATVSFELDDIDAAYEELDSRYLAGEVGGHAHTWSVIARECAAFNRHELPATDWVTIDHRQLAPIDASDLQAAMRAVWDLTPDLTTHIEAVHRLSSFGAVVTYTAHGTSREGFDAEWRMIEILTVERARLNRCEIFDEADLDAALARFEELQPQAPRLENAAIQVAERLRANFAARDWTARAELLAEDCSTEDRRRVVNAGNQHGRDADIANMRAIAAVGVANIALTTIATRGERLALSRARMSGRDAHHPRGRHEQPGRGAGRVRPRRHRRCVGGA